MKKVLGKLLALGLTVSIIGSSGAGGAVKTEAKSKASDSVSASVSQKSFYKEVSGEVYQKAIAKGFLGKKYGTGKGRYLCNTYVKKALEKVANKNLKKTKAESFKNFKITTKSKKKNSTPSSYDWNSYNINFSYTDCIYNEEEDAAIWDTEKSLCNIQKKNLGTAFDSLEMGQVLTYSGHVALYFGEYESKEAVAERLIELGVYSEEDLVQKKDRYVDKKGRTIIRDYSGAGVHWRIHATYSGLLIDNSIISNSALGTGTFGKWKKSIPTGLQVVLSEDEMSEESVVEA